MADVQVNLRLPAELLRRVDEQRGDVARNAWIRKQLELAVDREVPERHRGGYGPDVTRLRSSGQAKTGVLPIPRGK